MKTPSFRSHHRTPHPSVNGYIAAILGPTNTGKTHYAIERLLTHKTGMIGFPLRLLARENYDRIVALKGRSAVSLITGEEKYHPPEARYHICTVEAMPRLPVDFLAVDEIQLASDPERGHIFTDRLLNWRGQRETFFLGARTIESMIRRLIPKIDIIIRPRLSRLSYAGSCALPRLPPRSAVVAFSADSVYALAEHLRATAGGAAVVLGSLSPRARNAQADMFQSGAVDYMVATDAIGMGLNMDINHTAFAALRKFDGKRMRSLTPPELAQIAGRAGRHIREGSFGTTHRAGPLDRMVIEDIETHHFHPLPFLWWRNAELDFSSPRHLMASLDCPPSKERFSLLRRTPPSADRLALSVLAQRKEIGQQIKNPSDTRLLWDICRIPDYRKSLGDEHYHLLTRLFTHLHGNGLLPETWLKQQIDPLHQTEGGIDMLATRIAHIRTWNYIAFQDHWLADPDHWRAHTRQIEDRLSDALHQALIQRFVDERTTLVGQWAKNPDLPPATRDDHILIGGQTIGRLKGLYFTYEKTESHHQAKTIRKKIRLLVEKTLQQRVHRLIHDDHSALTLDQAGNITWNSEPIASLKPGPHITNPGITIPHNDFLLPKDKNALQGFLDSWLAAYLKEYLYPLWQCDPACLSPSGRGLSFRLQESLGSMDRRQGTELLSTLSRSDRRHLRQAGLVIGRYSLFFPLLLTPQTIALRSLLWCLWKKETPLIMPLPPTTILKANWSADYAQSIGYRLIARPGNRRHKIRPTGIAVRVDQFEAIAAEVWKPSKPGPFTAGKTLLALTGGKPEMLPALLHALGGKARKQKDIWQCYLPKSRPLQRSKAKSTPKRRAQSSRRRKQGSQKKS